MLLDILATTLLRPTSPVSDNFLPAERDTNSRINRHDKSASRSKKRSSPKSSIRSVKESGVARKRSGPPLAKHTVLQNYHADPFSRPRTSLLPALAGGCVFRYGPLETTVTCSRHFVQNVPRSLASHPGMLASRGFTIDSLSPSA